MIFSSIFPFIQGFPSTFSSRRTKRTRTGKTQNFLRALSRYMLCDVIPENWWVWECARDTFGDGLNYREQVFTIHLRKLSSFISVFVVATVDVCLFFSLFALSLFLFGASHECLSLVFCSRRLIRLWVVPGVLFRGLLLQHPLLWLWYCCPGVGVSRCTPEEEPLPLPLPPSPFAIRRCHRVRVFSPSLVLRRGAGSSYLNTTGCIHRVPVDDSDVRRVWYILLYNTVRSLIYNPSTYYLLIDYRLISITFSHYQISPNWNKTKIHFK